MKDQRGAIFVVVKYRNIAALSAVVALFAIELGAEPALPAFRRRHPRTLLPRRMMAHVLRVSALKLGHPVAVLVLVESNYFLFHRQSESSTTFGFPRRSYSNQLLPGASRRVFDLLTYLVENTLNQFLGDVEALLPKLVENRGGTGN